MSELILRNHQHRQPLDLKLFRQIAHAFLQEQLARRQFEIGIHIVAAPQMASINETYLGHTGSTDVITFGYTDPKSAEPLIGDIFLCIDDAYKHARRFRTSWQSELVRYFVHGMLHLQGYDDEKPGSRRVMKREENRLMKKLSRRFQLPGLG
jgi:probable rRNA maturation factor